MSENMAFGDWRDATPDKMREWSDAKLYLCMELGGLQYEPRARSELGRRQAAEIARLLATLEVATNRVHQETTNLARIGETSAIEVKRLVTSSLVIERLTKWLVGLTVVLSILTLVLVMDVAVKFTHDYFSPLPQLTTPQTPTRPPG